MVVTTGRTSAVHLSTSDFAENSCVARREVHGFFFQARTEQAGHAGGYSTCTCYSHIKTQGIVEVGLRATQAAAGHALAKTRMVVTIH